MSNSVFAAVLVLCGAVVGALGGGAVFGFVTASILEPSMPRTVLFGLTFGMAAGAIVAAVLIDRGGAGSTSDERLPSRLSAIVVVAIAVNTLFREGGWDVLFEGSRGLAMATTLMWICIVVWLATELPGKTATGR